MLSSLLCAILLAASATPTDARRGRGKQAGGRRKLKGDGLGKQVEATGPLHRAICDNRPCRPGEGNLVGYEHWKQPYELPSAASLAKRPPHGPASPLYAELVTVAKRVQSSRAFVLLTVADFDFREVAENWHKAATRANMPNAVVWSLDGDAYAHLSSRGVPTANGTAAIDGWAQTKLQRHLQRALAERQMAAAALVHAGLDVLVSDATWTYVRDAAPFFAAQPATVDLFYPKEKCGGKVNGKPLSTGCMPVWTLAYLRGAAGDERRARVLAWIAAGIDVGMVDFYLRWWSGHHCIDSGFGKLYQGEAPTGDLAPEAAVAQPNAPLYATFGKKRFTGLRLALMPLDLFPPPAKGAYAAVKATALAARAPNPRAERHRLRLDRYDESDFTALRASMAEEGLWVT